MDLSRQFPYNPHWRIILFGLVFGSALLACGRIHWLFFAAGIPFATFGLLLTARRVLLPQFLQLEQSSISIPKGFLRTWVTKIPYADIEREWETVHGSMRTLTLQVKGRKFEVLSMMFPDLASYVAVRDFVKSRVAPEEKTPRPVEAGKYGFRCSYEGNGEIYNSTGEVIWHFKTLHSRPHYPYGLFRLPDFVVYDKAEKELFRIKLKRRWSLGYFELVQNGSTACTIRQRSFLRNKFTLDFANGQNWVFRMPLFSVKFSGLSDNGGKIRVLVGASHNIWYALIDEKFDESKLVAALAFIHRERLRFN
jgi:hypothetical protein